MNFNWKSFLSIAIVLITISSVNQWTDLPIGSTSFWWVIYFLILIAFVVAKPYYFKTSDRRLIIFPLFYLWWNIISIIRGTVEAENYWEWKFLTQTGMVLLLPISIYLFTNKEIVQQVNSAWLKYALPLFFLIFPFLHTEAIGRYLVPISFLLLFLPALSKKWKIVVLAFTILVLIIDLGARSNVIKFAVPVIFSALYFFRVYISRRIMAIGGGLFLFLPIILFVLGILGIFNIFKMDEYIDKNYTINRTIEGEVIEENLKADTRTFLYVEVIESAVKYNYIWFGRTPARGNESESFGLHQLEELNTGKMERFDNEVSILNVFTWTGLVGALLYFLVFYRATFLAIERSNNFYMQILGLYLAFRWAYAWVEDYSRFDLSYVFLWMIIGMCYSSSFRAMSDLEMKVWVRGIFDQRYARVLGWYNFQKQVLLRSKLKKTVETK